MSAEYDATEFIDGDFHAHKAASQPASLAGPGQAQRAPTREEVDSKVAEAQQKLAELKRAQEQLERERAALEETRRRQSEFQTGRQELMQHLTRGVGLLQEAEFNARRDADQMAKTLAEFQDALNKIAAIHEEAWSKDSLEIELTRALTTLENARMEWNTARLKFAVLSRPEAEATSLGAKAPGTAPQLFAEHSFGELCRLGVALTWLPALALLVMTALLVLLLRH